MSHEELEHAVLGRSQRDGAIGHHHAMTGLVERQTFELDHFVSAIPGGTAQDGIDPSEQLTG